jgi:hypothetical protein
MRLRLGPGICPSNAIVAPKIISFPALEGRERARSKTIPATKSGVPEGYD